MNLINPMKHLPLTCAAGLLLAFGTASAATTATTAAKPAAAKPAYEQQYDADKKAANDRYAADRKICDEEKTSSIRMQCRRDAHDENQQALAAAKKKRDEAKKAAAQPAPAAASAAPAAAAATAAAASSAAICNECGKVIAINVGETKGKGGPIGLIAGGVAGAVLGHQVGGGRGKDIATIAGAAGGAYAGHKIEEKMTSSQTWSVSVRFENNEERSYTYDSDPKFVVGDKVKRADNGIVRY
ncbi:17 kDa surface antigen [Sterolibacterium denitrificans]|uniref:17 kDa surface antigen n=1 Tax=Sterolibacterium denitrificans TaxID=157592 RepID=A0A7Z7HQ02_9PROT|nr:glycine zipper 2TM domain-containing protein [Sterolibacterium denitrificans]SMB23955.1 17 kDa surface antigen [Sterolibacterium denitrificans]